MRGKTISVFAGCALAVTIIASGAAYASNGVVKNPPASITANVDMQEFARQLGIDPTGKTNGELKKAINESSFNVKKNPNAEDGKKRLTPEQQHQSLVALAEQRGIDTTGLTDAQIEDALKADKLNRSSNK
jgi:hypothetical protein